MNLPGEIEEFLSRFLGYEGFRFHLRRYLLFATLFALVVVGYVSSVAHHSANLTARYGFNPDDRQITPLIPENDTRSGTSSQEIPVGKSGEGGRRVGETGGEEPDESRIGGEGGSEKEEGAAGESRTGSETADNNQAGEGGREEAGTGDGEGETGREEAGTGDGEEERGGKGEGAGAAASVTSRSAAAAAAAGGGEKGRGKCAVEKGAWERDGSYPLYSSTCPFIEPRFACSGRPSSGFAKYRWQPAGCSLPRFDAEKLLSSFRDKRVVFAGDAVAKQMFLSLLCLVWAHTSSSSSSSSPSSAMYRVALKSIASIGRATKVEKAAIKSADASIWRSAEGNVTFVFFPTDYLVTTSSSSSRRASQVQVLLKQIGPWHTYAKQHADLLVLHAAGAFSDNAFLPPIATATPYGNSSDASSSSSQPVVFLASASPADTTSSKGRSSHDSLSAFHTALQTVNTWAQSTPRLKNIPVFFLGTPGHHFSSSKDPTSPRYKNIWKAKWTGKGTCDTVKVPLEKPHRDKERQGVIDSELASNDSSSSSSILLEGVNILPIGQTSAARADAHVSKWHGHTGSSRQDCVNFCLPGVPDIWNEFLLERLHPLL
ncbi:hypothetical protein CLOM_g23661 [Closterium sp. NIES-68]|nr:hypothetical protein CLOM_g23661 [Closterium sp. NIES-68]